MKVIHIEASTMLDILWKDVLPSVNAYTKVLADSLLAKKEISGSMNCSYETMILERFEGLTGSAIQISKELESDIEKINGFSNSLSLAMFCKNELLAKMNRLRTVVDQMEVITDRRYWPMPDYGNLLFSLK